LGFAGAALMPASPRMPGNFPHPISRVTQFLNRRMLSCRDHGLFISQNSHFINTIMT
jgi:hypothetical protein